MGDGNFEGGIRLLFNDPGISEVGGRFQYPDDTKRFLEAVSDLKMEFPAVRYQTQQRQQQMQQMQQIVAHLDGLWLEISSIAIPALAGLAGAWLTAKFGRRVRLKRGEIELEAGSIQELNKLLAMQSVLAAEEQEAIAERYGTDAILTNVKWDELELPEVLQARLEALERNNVLLTKIAARLDELSSSDGSLSGDS